MLSAVVFIGNIILQHIIKEEIWVKRIWYKIFPPKTFRNELYITINDTIDEYELSHPYDKNGIQRPFYHFKILTNILLEHVLFAKQNYSLDKIQEVFQNNPNIIKPTRQDLEDFFSLFINKTKSNKKLSKLFIDENYKNRIFEISGKIEIILDILLKAELTSEIIVKQLKEQTQFQIDKQKKSGKYIPETFIETNELKDHLRYFVAPFVFIDKIYEEIKKMQFNYLNRKLALKKQNNKFDFNITDFPVDEIKASCEKFDLLVNYINDKYSTLEKMGYNDARTASRKVEQKIDDLKYILSRVVILKDNAGQGKTNLLCDLAENVLLKRNIPALFFTGYELDANDLYNSIVKRLFPDKNYTFNDVFSRLDSYCEEKKTFFILLIDGLNENSNPQILSQSLELFITELLKYKHIKIILSCRTEYYKNNFENLSNAAFKNLLIQLTDLNRRLDEWQKRRLYETYLSHFQIKINNISDDIYKQLVDDFLLLRIFSEAYKGQTIASLTHIYKEELFQKYYKTESDGINKRLIDKDSFPEFDIKNFFRLIIQYMIERSCYENIPLDEILNKEPRYKELYLRFLDENILVRKDLDSQNGVFGNKEVVNFTFDEFRDFLITDYLLREMYPRNNQEFEGFLKQNIDIKSKIKEGCASFLFSMERKLNNEKLSDFIHKQEWYQDVFPYYIFDIQDNYVSDADKKQIKQIFLSDLKISEQITLSLAYQRWDERLFPKLNIQLLFEIFNELTDEQFEKNIYPIYPNKHARYYRSKSELDELLDTLEKRLEQSDFSIQPYRHNLFLYIFYLIPISNDVKYLYKRYWGKFNNKEHFEYILKCKSQRIKTYAQLFIQHYEVQL